MKYFDRSYWRQNGLLRAAYVVGRTMRPAIRDALEDNRFHLKVQRQELVQSDVHRHRLAAAAPYPVLFAGGGGLNYVEGTSMTQMLMPTLLYGYIFGIVAYGDSLYVSYNYHLGGRHRRTPSANRATAILRLRIDDLKRSIRTGAPLRHEQIALRTQCNLSYLNIGGDELAASNYLGSVHFFPLDRGSGDLLLEGERFVAVNRSIYGEPLYHYPYTHLNCISAQDGDWYVGAHMHTKMTGIGGRLYRVHAGGTVELARQTEFVSAHDMLLCDGAFYGCDSNRGTFYAGEREVFRGDGFARGLSITDTGYTVGITVKSEDRRERQKVSAMNHLVFLGRDGVVLAKVNVTSSSIYRVYAVGQPELSQSSPHVLEL